MEERRWEATCVSEVGEADVGGPSVRFRVDAPCARAGFARGPWGHAVSLELEARLGVMGSVITKWAQFPRTVHLNRVISFGLSRYHVCLSTSEVTISSNIQA